MAIYSKEGNSLIPNAGLGIIDKILNKFSDHAISNKAVSEEFEAIREEIANMDKRLDYGRSAAYTSGTPLTEDGVLLFGFSVGNSNGSWQISIDGKELINSYAWSSFGAVQFDVSAGDYATWSGGIVTVKFIPYKD